MKKVEVEYEPKFENVEKLNDEEKRRIFKMIDEGGPVYLKKIKKNDVKKE